MAFAGIRTIEDIMKSEKVGPAKATKIQEQEIIALSEMQKQRRMKVNEDSLANDNKQDKPEQKVEPKSNSDDLPIQRDSKGRFIKQPLNYVPRSKISGNLGVDNDMSGFCIQKR
jgi:hypothetical protein